MFYFSTHSDSDHIEDRSRKILVIMNGLGLDNYNMANPHGLHKIEPILWRLNEMGFQKVWELTFSNTDNREIFADAIKTLCTNNLFNESNLIRLINSTDIAQERDEILGISRATLTA